MFKLIITMVMLLVACSISGCWQTVNIDDIQAATKICKNYSSSVVEIYARIDGNESVLCSNRVPYLINSETVKEEK